jgi:DNA-binding beta-propeller fold protein YncE
LTATPGTVTGGFTSTLTWTSNGASSCTASGAWSGSKALSGSETVGPLQASASFTLSCGNAGGTTVQTTSVTVSIPPALPTGPMGSPGEVAVRGRAFELMPGWYLQDLVADPVSHRLYVSILNEVVVFSTDSYLIERRVKVGPRAMGLALSSTGGKLYVALAGGGSLAVVDTVTFATRVIEVAAELNTPAAWDVLEVRPGVVLVTGACGYSSLPPQQCSPYPVTVDTGNGDAVRRVAGAVPLYSSYPQSRLSRDGSRVYIAGDQPGRLSIELDNTSPDLPILRYGNRELTDQFEVNNSGTMLIRGGGGVVSTGDFSMLRSGWVNGAIGLDLAGSQMLLGQQPQLMLDAETLTLKSSYRADCGAGNKVAAAGHDGQWIIALTSSVSGLCVFSTTAPGVAPGAEQGPRTLPPMPITRNLPTAETAVRPQITDMAVDFPRNRIYVTGAASGANRLTIIDATTGSITGDVPMPGKPGRLTLSASGATLMIGLLDRAAVLEVDAQTLQVRSETSLAALSGGVSISMVFELTPTRWLASAQHPGGTAPPLPLLEFDPATPGSAHAVGDPRGYCDTTPYLSKDRKSLFLNFPGCDGSIERRDFTNPGLPLLARSTINWGLLGALWPVENEDGSLLYLMDGFVLRASNMTQVGKFDVFGRPFLVPGTNQILFANGLQLRYFDRGTYDRVASLRGYCPADDDLFNGSSVSSATIWPDFSRYAILGFGNARGEPGGVCFVPLL